MSCVIRPAVPPPPPSPNTTGTVGADVIPAAGKTNHTSTPSQYPINTVCSRDVIGASGVTREVTTASFTVIMMSRVLIGDVTSDYGAVDCEWLLR